MQCPSCGTLNEAGRKFCHECGSKLAAACSSCGSTNPPGARFCGECGTKLAAGTPAAGTAVGPGPAAGGTLGRVATTGPVAERRLVSVLFADLVGFTSLAEGRDAETVARRRRSRRRARPPDAQRHARSGHRCRAHDHRRRGRGDRRPDRRGRRRLSRSAAGLGRDGPAVGSGLGHVDRRRDARADGARGPGMGRGRAVDPLQLGAAPVITLLDRALGTDGATPSRPATAGGTGSTEVAETA